MLLVLKRSPEQEVALESLLNHQQDESSPNYHAWLTPEQFGQLFGPSDADIQAVTDWLQSHGFNVAKATKGRTIIEFSGTARQVQEAFHTEIHKFVVNGEEHWANASDPQIPMALAPAVFGPATLHNFRKHPNFVRSNIPWAAGKTVPGSRPQITFTSGNHGVDPADFAKIYNVPNMLNPTPPAQEFDGNGIVVAVVGRSNINVSDINDFRSLFGLPQNFSQSNVILNGPDPGNLGQFDVGEELEAVLDATWSGAAAPAATIDFVVSQSTETTDGVDLSAVFIVDQNLGNVMTESFGMCEENATAAFVSSEQSLAQQAAAQGITYVASSGDSGATCGSGANPNLVATQIPASTPYTVAVGGNMFIANDSTFWNATNSQSTFESAIRYIPEIVWNESTQNPEASGGGVSILFNKPVWQTGVTNIPSDGKRDVPDVAFDAAAQHDPVIICVADIQSQQPGGLTCVPNAQGEFTVLPIGGTSVAAPSFAGIMALVNAAQHNRQGQANYVLYKLAANEVTNPTLAQCNASTGSGPTSTACVFNDVTSGNNVVPGEAGTSFQAGSGYDLATGLGSANVANLIQAWSSVRTTASTTAVSSPTVFPITHSQSATFTITVAPQAGRAVPTGDVTLLANTGPSGAQLGIAAFTLNNGTVTASTGNLPGGQYNVTAHYEGDGTFAPSDSLSDVPVNVKPEASTTQIQVVMVDPNTGQITNNVTSAPYGSNIAVRVDVSTSLSGACPINTIATDCPAGTITLTANGQPLDGGSFTLNSLGNAEDQNVSTSLSPAPYQLSASYAGNASFVPSGPATDSVKISQATTTLSVTLSSNTIPAGGTVTLTAFVTTQSFGTPPSGTVTFFSGGAQLGNPIAVTGGFSSTGPGFAIASASLTTSLSNLPAPMSTFRRKPIFQFHPLSFILYIAFLWLFLRYAIKRNPHVRIYATLTLVLLCLGAIAACGGGGGGGGGGNQHTDTITARFSGDTNYTSSTSAAVQVTVE